MVLLWFFAIVFIIFVIVTVVSLNTNEKLQNIVEAIRDTPNFSLSNLLLTTDRGFAIDSSSKVSVVAVKHGSEIKTFVIPYNQITGVEIERVEGATTSNKTGLFKFTTNSALVSLTMRITFSNLEIPLLRVLLYQKTLNRNSSDTDYESKLQNEACEQANLWHGILSSIVLSNQQNKGSDITKPDVVLSLESLASLHNSGVLTDDEFKTAKTRILEKVLN